MDVKLIPLMVIFGLLSAVSRPCTGQNGNAGQVPLKVAAVCMNAKLDTATNLETFAYYIDEAAEQGTHLIVFPEIALQQNPTWGSGMQVLPDELAYVQISAETIPGPSTDKVVEMARSHRICVAFGMTERGADGNLYNASVFVTPSGVNGSYRKTSLWDTSLSGNEQLVYTRGMMYPVVQSPLGKAGLMIGTDMYSIPGNVRGISLANLGADFLVTPSAWPTWAQAEYDYNTKGNARWANRWHFVANQTGDVGHLTGFGHSQIVDPRGVIIADTGSEEGMVVVETDLMVAPPVDFDGNGQVDGQDVLLLADHWGQDALTYDIAPPPLGDGIVDIQDLIVLADYIGREMDDPALVAHWPLDDLAGDIATESIRQNDGTVLGGAAWVPEEGVVDGALHLDGVDGFMKSPRTAAMHTGPLSVLLWIKGGGPGQVIISASEGSDWLLASVAGRVGVAGRLMTRSGSSSLTSNTVVTDGQWHRVGLVCDGVTRSLYVDEVLAAEDEVGLTPTISRGLHIGAGANLKPGTFFSGLIDDVRIYNRAVRP